MAADPSPRLVGRHAERDALTQAVAGVRDGLGGLLLVSGDAGAGKTTLVESVLEQQPCRVLRGAAHRGGTEPYGPLSMALAQSRSPSTPASGDAVGEHLRALGEQEPTVLFLDDLHWADAATAEVLSRLLVTPAPRLLVIGAYRSDELPRHHPVRMLRTDLRRTARGSEREIRLGGLSDAESEAVVRDVLGAGADPAVVAAVRDRARGLPFFLRELARGVRATDASQPAPDVVPESVRDAVLARVNGLDEPGQRLAETIAAAGHPLDSDVVDALGEAEGVVDELLDAGLVLESTDPDTRSRVAFRHDLMREALYAATPWVRRRRAHAALAAALEQHGAPAAVRARHWRDAYRPEQARPLFVEAARAAFRVHAYRDAKAAAEEALEMWPDDGDEAGRVDALTLVGDCAERCGAVDDAEAARRQVVESLRTTADDAALAAALQALAGSLEMQSDWAHAVSCRREAAEAFAAAGNQAQAVRELLIVADILSGRADVTTALGVIGNAWELIAALETEQPESEEIRGLRALVMANDGHLRAIGGDGARGVELTRQALDLALVVGPDALAAQVFALHSYTLELATEYEAGLISLTEAYDYCRTRGLDEKAHLCLACLTPALRHTGRWDRALEVGEEVLDDPDAFEPARMVANGETGLILANRGDVARAGARLRRAEGFVRAAPLIGLKIETWWGLARLDDLEGAVEPGAERLRELLARCADREERHYSIAALRWAATFFGRRDLREDLSRTIDVLSRMAAEVGTPEATGALAHALGEQALAEGDPAGATAQFERTLALLRGVPVPPEIAETQWRAGVAWAAAGDRERALELLTSAYRTATNLRAKPLARAVVAEVERLGEDVAGRLGKRAARYRSHTDLTSREREVLQLVAEGLTNRDIAERLFLSTRTVDMHVRHLLTKLDCPSRTAAVRRATQLSLIGS